MLCFIWWEFLGLKPGRQNLKWPLENYSKDLGEGDRLHRSVQQRASSLNIKRILWIKENQTPQVKEFSAFLCMGRCQSLGSLKSLLSYASQLSGANIQCFHIQSPSVLTVGNGYSLLTLRSHRYSPSWEPLGLKIFTFGQPESLMTVILVYWWCRKYSSSQHSQIYKPSKILCIFKVSLNQVPAEFF